MENIDIIIMAGGRGERLRPITNVVPKPMLPIHSKPILQHNIDKLRIIGCKNFYILTHYKSDYIINYFSNLKARYSEVNLNFITEPKPLGTIGGVYRVPVKSDCILLLNADIITDIDYNNLYEEFKKSEMDMAVTCFPHKTEIPYATIEIDPKTQQVISFLEKPQFTHYINAGIYLIKTKCLKYIPKNTFYHATDFMQVMIDNDHKIFSYPITSYWVDIGTSKDYMKAQTIT